jgi:hypothetical protein
MDPSGSSWWSEVGLERAVGTALGPPELFSELFWAYRTIPKDEIAGCHRTPGFRGSPIQARRWHKKSGAHVLSTVLLCDVV